MAEKYEDEEMIQDAETPEEYLDDSGEDHAAAAKAEADKKKKDKMFKLAVFGVAAVVGGGLIYTKLGNKHAPAPVAAQAEEPKAEPSAAAKDPLAPTAPQAAQVGGLPTVTPAIIPPAGAVDPLAAKLPTESATIQAAPEVAGMNAAVAAPAANASLPAGGANAVVAAPVPAPESEGVVRALDELKASLMDLTGMFKKFEDLDVGTRLKSLEDRVAALESGKGAGKASKGLGQKQDSVGGSEKEKSQKSASWAKKKSPKAIDGMDVKPLKIEGVVEPKPPKISLQAVIPGRMWVRMPDGTSQNFTVGDALPDGSKVVKIEAEKGKVVTSKGVMQ